MTFDPVTRGHPGDGSAAGGHRVGGGGREDPRTVITTSPIVFRTRPTATPIGGYVTPPVQVLVQDESGAPIAGATVTLSLDSNPGGATLHGGSATTGSDGHRDVRPAVARPGRATGYRLRATDRPAPPKDSGPFDVVPLVVTTTGDSRPRHAAAGDRERQPERGLRGRDLVRHRRAAGVHTIACPRHCPPVMPTPLTIDATTQPGYAGTPLIEINGQSVSSGLDMGPGVFGSVIRGLSIYGFSGSGSAGSGIRLGPPGGSVVEACYIGLDATGVAHGNSNGVRIDGQSDANRIGGTSLATRNVISGNASNGILIDGGNANVIAGNYIGTDPSGTAARPNGQGVTLQRSSTYYSTANNVIGGSLPGEGNVISGNTGTGIAIEQVGPLAPSGTYISGNTVGLTPDGTGALGNTSTGISVAGPNTSILGNVVANNLGLGGIAVRGLADGTVVRANRVGTNATGTVRQPNNVSGIVVIDSTISNVVIGGTGPADGNLCSGNAYAGIFVSGGARGHDPGQSCRHERCRHGGNPEPGLRRVAVRQRRRTRSGPGKPHLGERRRRHQHRRRGAR